jgi:hypothetical protein
MAIAYNTSIVRNGLVLQLDAANPKSYPGTSTTWSDLSGNANNGTLVNGVGYSSADNGSLTFDGVDDYVSISQVGNTSSFSYEVFLKPTQVTKDQMYIGYSPIAANYVRITESKAFLSVSAGGQRTLTHSETLVNNQVYHIVSTYDGVQLKIYVNNNLTAGPVINQTLAGWGTDRIGRWRDADQRSFVGNIYSLITYNRALTAQEVAQNFEAMRGRYGI